MEVKNQVCTLAQAKKLKELGVIGPSYFSWFGDEEKRLVDNGKEGLAVSDWLFVLATKPRNNQELDWRSDTCVSPIAPAFTVSEFGAMIGRGTKAAEKHWQWLLDCVNSGVSGTIGYDPVALAGHVITQIENGTLTAEECNNRLTPHP